MWNGRPVNAPVDEKQAVSGLFGGIKGMIRRAAAMPPDKNLTPFVANALRTNQEHGTKASTRPS
jgi:hypothetical protein